MHLESGTHSWFESEGELGEVDETLDTGVRSHIGERLDHEMRLKSETELYHGVGIVKSIEHREQNYKSWN